MKKDFSYGVIPLRRMHGHLECYLIKNRNGQYWGFPKGHAEGQETPRCAAERELLEETGLEIVNWLSEDCFEEIYIFGFEGKLIEKKVFYFLAEVSKAAVIQQEEILDGSWVEVDQVEKLLTYEASKQVFRQAKVHFSNNSFSNQR